MFSQHTHPHRLHRVLVASAVGASLALLAGCSAAGTDDAADSSGTIVFDFPYTALPVYGELVSAATARADELGYELLTTEDDGAVDVQVSNLTTMTNRGVDAIVSFPIEPSALATVMRDAQDAGAKWITYGTNIEGEDSSIDLSGFDTGRALARTLGEYADANTGGEGTVLVIGTSTNDLGRERTRGMVEGLAEFAPEVTVLQEETNNAGDSVGVTQARLSTNPEIDYVMAVTDDDAIGAATALREAGYDPATTWVGGLDGTLPALTSIAAGDDYFKATIALSAKEVGELLVDMAVGLIEGEDVEPGGATPIIVTADYDGIDRLIADAQ